MNEVKSSLDQAVDEIFETKELVKPDIEKKAEELSIYAPDDAVDKVQYVKLVMKQLKISNVPDLVYFLNVAKTTGLNPVNREIYGIYRRPKAGMAPVLTIQTGIDGFRKVAARDKTYAGSDAGVFEYDPEGKLTKCTVSVYKVNYITGERMPITATALWKEYYPGIGKSPQWDKMPETMLEKCAEAKALRKAFPNTGQLYVTEEMNQADDILPVSNVSKNVEAIAEAKEIVKEIKDEQTNTAS
jgi:phage recombination protein Bet